MTLSLANSSCSIPTSFFAVLAATRAASFTKFARSAPENPGVPLAIREASTSCAIGTFFMCTFRICSLPLISGKGTTTCLSNLPGLNKAGSKTSGLLVAAIIIIA